MKYRFKLMIIVVATLCLSLAAMAPAYTHKALYVDGQFIDDANAVDILEFALGTVVIGAQGKGYVYNEYVGKMDEFAIYSGILSDARILAHYNAASSDAAYTSAVNADQPLAWLRFEDVDVNNGMTAENSGQSLTDATYVQTGGSPFAKVVGGGINGDSNAIEFPGGVSGGSGHTVQLPDNGEFSTGIDGIVTVELWVNLTQCNTSNPGDDSDWSRLYQTNGGYGMSFEGPNQFSIQGGSNNNSINFWDEIGDLNDGQWHHVVVTFDSVPEARILPDHNSFLEEIAEDNPIVWLRFEDETPRDFSGNNHWVRYGPAASIVSEPNAMYNCVYLDGNDGQDVFGVAVSVLDAGEQLPYDDVNETYAVYGDQYAFAPGDITIEMWYKSDINVPTYAYFFQQHGSNTNELVGPAVGRAGGEFRISGGDALGYTGVNPKLDGQWHQLVVTYDEDYEGDPNRLFAQVYVDGLLKDTTDFGNDPNATFLGPEMSHMMIGAENDMGNTFNVFKGWIDEFIIYEGILDANTIDVHYAAWVEPLTCEELIGRNMVKDPNLVLIDLNKDCIINFYDFAVLAEEWMLCNDPLGSSPPCAANWPL